MQEVFSAADWSKEKKSNANFVPELVKLFKIAVLYKLTAKCAKKQQNVVTVSHVRKFFSFLCSGVHDRRMNPVTNVFVVEKEANSEWCRFALKHSFICS